MIMKNPVVCDYSIQRTANVLRGKLFTFTALHCILRFQYTTNPRHQLLQLSNKTPNQNWSCKPLLSSHLSTLLFVIYLDTMSVCIVVLDHLSTSLTTRHQYEHSFGNLDWWFINMRKPLARDHSLLNQTKSDQSRWRKYDLARVEVR